MDDSDKRKLIFKDVSTSLSVSELELIFENKRYVGNGDFEIVGINELILGENGRDIILEYASEDSVQALLKIEKIVYKNFNLVPFLYTSCQPARDKSLISVTYEIKDTYRYPFYLLTLNEDLLKNFGNELKNMDASIKSIGENDIVIEKKFELFDTELVKKWFSDLEEFLTSFEKENFGQLQMKNIDEYLWPEIRNEAIDFCKKTNKLNLIYQNKPDNFLRIEGEKNLIEKFIKNSHFVHNI